jgi:hypothetical protein
MGAPNAKFLIVIVPVAARAAGIVVDVVEFAAIEPELAPELHAAMMPATAKRVTHNLAENNRAFALRALVGNVGPFVDSDVVRSARPAQMTKAAVCGIGAAGSHCTPEERISDGRSADAPLERDA